MKNITFNQNKDILTLTDAFDEEDKGKLDQVEFQNMMQYVNISRPYINI